MANGSVLRSRNPHTLVEVTSFTAINKFQPFNVAISSNVLLLLVGARDCPQAQLSWGDMSDGDNSAGRAGQGQPGLDGRRRGVLWFDAVLLLS